MEEKRNITISLQETREKSQINLIKTACELPYSERGKWDTLHKLAIMAKYYNGD